MRASEAGEAAGRQNLARMPWFFAAARVSFALGGALPWALPFARAWWPLGPIGVLLDGVFYFVCHRRPERTLVLAGVPMPLCSRCAGIAAGLAIGAILAWPSPSLRATRIFAAVAAALMITDVVTQDLGVHPVWHATRIATGGMLGYVLAIGLFAGIRREWAATRGGGDPGSRAGRAADMALRRAADMGLRRADTGLRRVADTGLRREGLTRIPRRGGARRTGSSPRCPRISRRGTCRTGTRGLSRVAFRGSRRGAVSSRSGGRR